LDRQRAHLPAGLSALLSGLLLTAVLGCSPVSTGSWYDSEKDGQPDFFERRQASQAGSQRKSTSRPTSGQISVGAGDTYYSLSRRHKVPLRALMEANNARPPYTLAPGDRLRLPRQQFYTVQRKDTLYSISRKFGTDVSTLAKSNGLAKPYAISVGQSLQVPSGKADTQRRVESSARASAKPKAASKTMPQVPRRAGRFLMPVRGTILSGFGPKPGGLHNDGINIGANRGTPIKAAENGVVVYAGNELRGYGNLLLVRHSGGWVTAYAHIGKFRVRQGAKVKQGEVIGEVGNSGSVDRPQLHFEIRKGTRAVNPNSLI